MPTTAAAPQKPFDGAMYNMMGSPYAMLEADVMVYAQPYKVSMAPAASTLLPLHGGGTDTHTPSLQSAGLCIAYQHK